MKEVEKEVALLFVHYTVPTLLSDESLSMNLPIDQSSLCKEKEVEKFCRIRPVVNPPDFDLFPNLKDLMRGSRYPSLEELYTTVTRKKKKERTSDSISKENYLVLKRKAVLCSEAVELAKMRKTVVKVTFILNQILMAVERDREGE
ncbi:hypothetical protein C0J52_00519 [Blattella germanica]|nr:hypothetical protein C0J52_00519 [Blattella germanica]